MCFVHEAVDEPTKSEVRSAVCSDLIAEFVATDKNYCLFHYPGPKPSTDFDVLFKKRIDEKKYDFRYVYFPEELFLIGEEFDLPVTFFGATFEKAIHFATVQFREAVDFSGVTFNKNVVFLAVFFWGDAIFDGCTIVEDARCLFSICTFFRLADFKLSTVRGRLRFEGGELANAGLEGTRFGFVGNNSTLDFRNLRIENDDAVHFYGGWLRPSWFVDAHVRKITFTGIEWENVNETWSNKHIDTELRNMEGRGIRNAKHLLAIACRQLSANYDENHQYDEASRFRQMAFEIGWQEKSEEAVAARRKLLGSLLDRLKHRKDANEELTHTWGNLITSPYPSLIFHRLYRFSSRFGESPGRALFVLLRILVLTSVLYVLPFAQFDKSDKRSLDFPEAISYSLRTMVLQRPEPFPENNFAKFVVAGESILAPLQLALLALAVRRKFMK